MSLPGQQSPRTGIVAGAGGGVPRLQVRELAKRYGAVVAAEGVSFDCLPGEVHALVGENGAGKSTVAKIVAGLVRADSGEVLIDGEPLPGGSIAAAHRGGVYCAFQELALVPQWTVAECLALVDARGARVFRPSASRRWAAERLQRLGLEIDPKSKVETLPLAVRQQVEIARALLKRPKILLLDEASSALTPPGVDWLFERIRELTREGAAVVYVSHRLGEIRDIADRGTVLRDGRRVDGFVRGGYDENGLIAAMAGQPTGDLFPDRPPLDGEAPVALAVEGLDAAGVEDVSLSVRSGEILGVGGLQGHGQAELLRCLYGARPARVRSWQVGGKALRRRMSPRRAVRAGFGFVPEDRKREGLAMDVSVGENLLAPWVSPLGGGGAPLVRRRRGWIDNVLGALSIKTRGPSEPVVNLSGGNQQKVVFGRWLERDRRVLLLHDPTRGIDVGSKHELYMAVVEQARRGTAVIWLSTEVEELVHLCHRVLVLYGGQIHSELSAAELSAERVVGAVVGKAEA